MYIYTHIGGSSMGHWYIAISLPGGVMQALSPPCTKYAASNSLDKTRYKKAQRTCYILLRGSFKQLFVRAEMRAPPAMRAKQATSRFRGEELDLNATN